ncbi:MAG: GDP-mannose 4,6-dehydratase [Candidatus Falkowbacteria bacterium]|nr:MAG: GDP-mannose 4,6-dehydratase [Candidatus Falkowbacteria bacterium]
MKTAKKKAIIVGASGQDGRLLFELLADSGYSVIGLDKNGIKTNRTAWKSKINISDKHQVFSLIKKFKPDEIYYLAAYHFSSQDKRGDIYQELRQSYEINVLAFLNFLEGVRLFSPKTKIFYAGSSLLFGNPPAKIQTEKTPFNPNSAYSLSKAGGASLCRLYREKYQVFAAMGIMYNHESEYRTDNFLSMKIIRGAKNIAAGKQQQLVVGDLKARVDWGYAPDYVYAMKLILNLKKADDFIIATGQSHSVLDFIKITFKEFGLDWKKYVREDKKIISEKRKVLIGDAGKLKTATGWKPSVSFAEMIKEIINNLDK